jgi:hypothetical protein
LTAAKRIYLLPYAFELFVIANLAVIHLMFRRDSNAVLTTLPSTLLAFGTALLLQGAGGVVVRLIIAAGRGDARAYLRIIRSPGWLTDTFRLILFGSLMTHVYGWIKLTVPLFHARRFDQELWNLDRTLFFGYSPNVLFLDIFSSKPVLHAVDWSYAMIFVCSMSIAFGYILSAPSRRLRTAFMTGNVVLWIAGAWLYLLVPSLGPAFGFPEIWFAYSESLGRTQSLQAMLLRNYQNVLQVRTTGADVNVLYGIGAFPSLHVGFQTYVFLWMRRLWTYGEIVFGVFLFAIFLGSMITGWHYLVDGLAGILLAALAYRFAASAFRIRSWRRLAG